MKHFPSPHNVTVPNVVGLGQTVSDVNKTKRPRPKPRPPEVNKDAWWI